MNIRYHCSEYMAFSLMSVSTHRRGCPSADSTMQLVGWLRGSQHSGSKTFPHRLLNGTGFSSRWERPSIRSKPPPHTSSSVTGHSPLESFRHRQAVVPLSPRSLPAPPKQHRAQRESTRRWRVLPWEAEKVADKGAANHREGPGLCWNIDRGGLGGGAVLTAALKVAGIGNPAHQRRCFKACV